MKYTIVNIPVLYLSSLIKSLYSTMIFNSLQKHTIMQMAEAVEQEIKDHLLSEAIFTDNFLLVINVS